MAFPVMMLHPKTNAAKAARNLLQWLVHASAWFGLAWGTMPDRAKLVCCARWEKCLHLGLSWEMEKKIVRNSPKLQNKTLLMLCPLLKLFGYKSWKRKGMAARDCGNG